MGEDCREDIVGTEEEDFEERDGMAEGLEQQGCSIVVEPGLEFRVANIVRKPKTGGKKLVKRIQKS